MQGTPSNFQMAWPQQLAHPAWPFELHSQNTQCLFLICVIDAI